MTLTEAIASAKDGTVISYSCTHFDRVIVPRDKGDFVKAVSPAELAALRAQYPSKFVKEMRDERDVQDMQVLGKRQF